MYIHSQQMSYTFISSTNNHFKCFVVPDYAIWPCSPFSVMLRWFPGLNQYKNRIDISTMYITVCMVNWNMFGIV